MEMIFVYNKKSHFYQFNWINIKSQADDKRWTKPRKLERASVYHTHTHTYTTIVRLSRKAIPAVVWLTRNECVDIFDCRCDDVSQPKFVLFEINKQQQRQSTDTEKTYEWREWIDMTINLCHFRCTKQRIGTICAWWRRLICIICVSQFQSEWSIAKT